MLYLFICVIICVIIIGFIFFTVKYGFPYVDSFIFLLFAIVIELFAVYFIIFSISMNIHDATI